MIFIGELILPFNSGGEAQHEDDVARGNEDCEPGIDDSDENTGVKPPKRLEDGSDLAAGEKSVGPLPVSPLKGVGERSGLLVDKESGDNS